MSQLRTVLSCIVGALLLLAIGCGAHSDPAKLVSISSTANPLVAQVDIVQGKTGNSAWVEFGPDTNYGRKTSPVTDSSSSSAIHLLSVLVAGMRPQTTYHMRTHIDSPGGEWVDQDRTFTTGALPTGVAPPKVTISTPTSGTSPAPGVELLSLIPNPTTSQTMQPVVTDLQGNVIWYCPQAAVPPRALPNGHFLFQDSVSLDEVDLACNPIRSVTLAQVNQSLQSQGYKFPAPLNFFHHDAIALPNGHWIALGQITVPESNLQGYPAGTIIDVLGDVLVDIDLNGNVAWAWSAFDHLDLNRHLEGLPDWTHSNAIVYTSDGNLLLSMRHQSWVLKIDYQNGSGKGDILWRLGEGGDFVLAGGNPADWFYAQHFPVVLSVNGTQTTLAVYDDGNYRIDSTGNACDPNATPSTCYTRATIFQIDESTLQATLAWSDLPNFFSYWGGSISALSNGDVEYDSSDPLQIGNSEIIEVEQTGSTPHAIVWQMTILGQSAYRGYRMPSLYPGVTWEK